MADRKDTELLIQRLTEKYGVEKTSKFISYIDKVLERNEHINLTVIFE